MKASVLACGPVLGLLALCGLVMASPPAPPTTLIILSGHLTHAPQGDSVRLQVGTRRVATILSPAGDFRFVLAKVPASGQARFSYGGQTTLLWLRPGDRQHLTLDFLKFDETVQYSGRGAAASNYLARAIYRFEADAPGQVPSPFSHLTPQSTSAEFEHQVAANQQQRQAFLTSYAQVHSLPATFVQDQQQVIDLQGARDRLNFPAYWNWIHRNDSPAQPLVLPATYFDFVRQLPLPRLLAHPTPATKPVLEELLYAYTSRLLPSGHLSTDPAEASRLYAVATAELGATAARDQTLYNLFTDQLLHDFPGVAAAYPTFKVENRDSTLGRQLRQKLVARRAFEPGQPAPNFTLHDNIGKQVSLSELRGKVVYLDFWGTWCPPCMEEMTKHSHALKEHFLGQDVVFVYVSVRDAQAQWQRVLQQQQLTSTNSVHLWAPDKGVSTLYQVPYYPCYYLIGRDGRFVQAYTTRPSDGPKTVAAIEAALNAPATANAQR